MPPASKRKRTPEKASSSSSSSALSGQSSLRFFFAQGAQSPLEAPPPSATSSGTLGQADLTLRRPTTAEEEEADLRCAIEASLCHDAVGTARDAGADGVQGRNLAAEPPASTEPRKHTANSYRMAPAGHDVIDLSSDEGDQDECEAMLALANGNKLALVQGPKDENQERSARAGGLVKVEVPKNKGSSTDQAVKAEEDVKAEEPPEIEDHVKVEEGIKIEIPEGMPLVSPEDEGDERKVATVLDPTPDDEGSRAGWSRLGLGRGGAALAQRQDKKGEGKGGQSTKPKRSAPFYKVLRGMPLSVDAFTYGKIEGCQGYFLSHFHSDHYGSLSKTWSHGLIYCSKLTAALCQRCLGVGSEYLRPLDFDVPCCVPNSGGVTVTLIPANHCPGSALFLFEGPCTHDLVDPTYTPSRAAPPRIARYLHCGDFRASPSHTSHPALRGKALDLIYLDTTYCNPKYIFPPQPLVIQACVDLILSSVARLLPPTASDLPGLHTGDCTGPPIRPSRQLSLPFAKARNTLSPSPLLTPSLSCGLERFVTSSSASQDPPVGPSTAVVPAEEDAWPAEASLQRNLCAESGLVLLIGTYTIGKERLVLALAEALGTKIFCANPRQRLMWGDVARCAADQERVQRQRAPLGPGEDAADVLLHEETSLARLSDYLTSNPPEAGIHVVRLGSVSPEQSRAYLAQLSSQRARQKLPPIRHAMSLRPTGWTFRPSTSLAPSTSSDDTGDTDQAPKWTAVLKPAAVREKTQTPHTLLQSWQQQGYSMQDIGRARGSGDGLEVLPIPYSEHSSFTELTAFALSLPWTKIIPTVGVGSPAGRTRMQAHFAQWSAAQAERPPPPPRGQNYW